MREKSECHFVMKWIEVAIFFGVRREESTSLPMKIELTSHAKAIAGTLLREI